MNLFLKIGFWLVIIFSFVFSSWSVLHGDIYFSADIGRDFHLYREVDEKILVLIGPRSSTGLFHGPLWTYLNYPAYLIGGGNPVTVGWYWVLLSSIFVVINFFIAKDLFGKLSAYFFAAMTAIYVAYHISGMYNPHGAMFLVPLFFYLFIKYLRSKKIKFLIFLIITGGLILQFQLAVGVPLLILSLGYIFVRVIRKGNRKHLLTFLLLPIMVSNFIIFDIRHDNLYLDKIFGFITLEEKGEIYNYTELINDRIKVAFSGVEILRNDKYFYLNLIFFLSVISFSIFLIKKNKHKDIYLSFLYFYFGFFILSFINKGPILYFYVFPLFPLVFLIICSFLDTKYKNYLIIPLIMIFTINILNAFEDIKGFSDRIGKDAYSWKFLKEASEKMLVENDFGYFVYSPDSVAYEGRYAAIYVTEKSGKGSYYVKKPITYVLSAPTPENKFVTGDEWWIKNKVNIKSEPVSVITFDNGYKLKKYSLLQEDLEAPLDGQVDTGLHFR